MKKYVTEKETVEGWANKGDKVQSEVYGYLVECSKCLRRVVDDNFKYCPYCGDKWEG